MQSPDCRTAPGLSFRLKVCGCHPTSGKIYLAGRGLQALQPRPELPERVCTNSGRAIPCPQHPSGDEPSKLKPVSSIDSLRRSRIPCTGHITPWFFGAQWHLQNPGKREWIGSERLSSFLMLTLGASTLAQKVFSEECDKDDLCRDLGVKRQYLRVLVGSCYTPRVDFLVRTRSARPRRFRSRLATNHPPEW